jgi:hypothetical protein
MRRLKPARHEDTARYPAFGRFWSWLKLAPLGWPLVAGGVAQADSTLPPTGSKDPPKQLGPVAPPPDTTIRLRGDVAAPVPPVAAPTPKTPKKEPCPIKPGMPGSLAPPQIAGGLRAVTPPAPAPRPKPAPAPTTGVLGQLPAPVPPIAHPAKPVPPGKPSPIPPKPITPPDPTPEPPRIKGKIKMPERPESLDHGKTTDRRSPTPGAPTGAVVVHRHGPGEACRDAGAPALVINFERPAGPERG